jgi:hypothetical protein
MSHTGFNWSDEQSAPPQAPAPDQRFKWSDEDTSETEQKTATTPPPATTAKTPDEGGPVARFVNRFTGLPAHDIAEHPNAYLNPFSHEYWQKGEEENQAREKAAPPQPRIPGTQTYRDIKAGNYAGAAGDIAGPALAITSVLGGDVGEEVPMRPEPAWKTAPTERTPVPSILDRQPYAAPARAIPETPAETPRPARPVPAWKTAPTEGTPVESVLNRQPYAGPARPRPIPEAPAPSTAGQMVASVAPQARAIPAPFDEPLAMAPEIRRVPSTNEIREQMQQQVRIPQPGSREDMMEDRALQQEDAGWLDEQGRRADSEARRRAIAGSSTGITKGDLVRQAAGNRVITAPVSRSAETPAADDLTPEWQAELDRVKARKSGKAGKKGE